MPMTRPNRRERGCLPCDGGTYLATVEAERLQHREVRRRRRTLVTSACPTASNARSDSSPARVTGSQLTWRRRSTSTGTVGPKGRSTPEILATRCSTAAGSARGETRTAVYAEPTFMFVGEQEPVETSAGQRGPVRERLGPVAVEFGNTTRPTIR